MSINTQDIVICHATSTEAKAAAEGRGNRILHGLVCGSDSNLCSVQNGGDSKLCGPVETDKKLHVPLVLRTGHKVC